MRLQLNSLLSRMAALLGAVATTFPARAAVLPEDRADAMYHYYDGGGVEVTGPALLLRKTFAEKISVSAAQYVDVVSSASVDVLTTASPFKETRKEIRGGLDYLDGNSIVGFSVVRSDEPDYKADNVSLGVSHELFGAMTTVSLGYAQGKDEVLKTDSGFKDEIERQQYRVGVSQVMTKRLVASLNYEAITEEGFLNSPYRSARLLGAYVPERYPRTRNSHAVALRGVVALGEAGGRPTSSLGVGTRFFDDSWNISAREYEVNYQRYLPRDWIGEIYFRHYAQTAASFYSDNFYAEFAFMARDKELSTFDSNALGVKGTWRFCGGSASTWRCELSFEFSRVQFDYDNFTDVRTGQLFSFDANVASIFVSLWY